MWRAPLERPSQTMAWKIARRVLPTISVQRARPRLVLALTGRCRRERAALRALMTACAQWATMAMGVMLPVRPVRTVPFNETLE